MLVIRSDQANISALGQVFSEQCHAWPCCMHALLGTAADDIPHTVLPRFVKDRDGKGGKVVKLTGSLDAKSRWVTN